MNKQKISKKTTPVEIDLSCIVIDGLSIDFELRCQKCGEIVVCLIDAQKKNSWQLKSFVCSNCKDKFDIELLGVVSEGVVARIYGPRGGIREIRLFEYGFKLEFPYGYFKGNIQNILDTLSQINLSQNLNNNNKISLNRILYAHMITVMETYLYETLWENMALNRRRGSYKRFSEIYPPWNNEKITLSRVLDFSNNIGEAIQNELTGRVVFHNLPFVKTIYEKYFDITFPDFKRILPIIEKRHDIVHRGGRDKLGHPLIVDQQEIIISIEIIEKFIDELALLIMKKTKRKAKFKKKNL